MYIDENISPSDYYQKSSNFDNVNENDSKKSNFPVLNRNFDIEYNRTVDFVNSNGEDVTSFKHNKVRTGAHIID
ncbi:MAG: hypothetical protein ACRCW0_04085 [Clostridium sp.]